MPKISKQGFCLLETLVACTMSASVMIGALGLFCTTHQFIQAQNWVGKNIAGQINLLASQLICDFQDAFFVKILAGSANWNSLTNFRLGGIAQKSQQEFSEKLIQFNPSLVFENTKAQCQSLFLVSACKISIYEITSKTLNGQICYQIKRYEGPESGPFVVTHCIQTGFFKKATKYPFFQMDEKILKIHLPTQPQPLIHHARP